MKIEIRLRIDGDDEEVLVLDKPHDRFEQLGLSLDEAKDILGQLQERIVAVQAAAFVEDNRCCPHGVDSGSVQNSTVSSPRHTQPYDF